jgi:hypothetical protein
VRRISRRVKIDRDDGSFVMPHHLPIAQIEMLHKPAA